MLNIPSILGMVTQLPQEFFEFLTDFQRRLCYVIRSVGKIEHDQWRSFCNERKTEAMEVKSLIIINSFLTIENFSNNGLFKHDLILLDMYFLRVLSTAISSKHF